ncbi:hypothetical protein ACS0TY_020614 [Phlomoides rotata]
MGMLAKFGSSSEFLHCVSYKIPTSSIFIIRMTLANDFTIFCVAHFSRVDPFEIIMVGDDRQSNTLRGNQEILYVLLEKIILKSFFIIIMIIHILNKRCHNKRKQNVRYSMIDRIPGQAVHMGRLIGGGLVDGKHVSVEEQVVMFLSILAHHKENRVVKFNHQRYGQMVSHYVHVVLLTDLKISYQMIAQILDGSGLRYHVLPLFVHYCHMFARLINSLFTTHKDV